MIDIAPIASCGRVIKGGGLFLHVPTSAIVRILDAAIRDGEWQVRARVANGVQIYHDHPSTFTALTEA